MGAHQRERFACPLRVHSLGEGEGKTSAIIVAGKRGEDFPAGHVKSNFLCTLGYGDPSKLLPRGPRLEFNEACTLM
jgi:hypothetical protein